MNDSFMDSCKVFALSLFLVLVPKLVSCKSPNRKSELTETPRAPLAVSEIPSSPEMTELKRNEAILAELKLFDPRPEDMIAFYSSIDGAELIEAYEKLEKDQQQEGLALTSYFGLLQSTIMGSIVLSKSAHDLAGVSNYVGLLYHKYVKDYLPSPRKNGKPTDPVRINPYKKSEEPKPVDTGVDNTLLPSYGINESISFGSNGTLRYLDRNNQPNNLVPPPARKDLEYWKATVVPRKDDTQVLDVLNKKETVGQKASESAEHSNVTILSSIWDFQGRAIRKYTGETIPGGLLSKGRKKNAIEVEKDVTSQKKVEVQIGQANRYWGQALLFNGKRDFLGRIDAFPVWQAFTRFLSNKNNMGAIYDHTGTRVATIRRNESQNGGVSVFSMSKPETLIFEIRKPAVEGNPIIGQFKSGYTDEIKGKIDPRFWPFLVKDAQSLFASAF